MAKHHPQPTPRPVPAPTPIQAAPKMDAPVLLSCVLGRTADGRHAAALLRTQGLTVVSWELVDAPTRERAVAEEAWNYAAYPAVYLGQTLKTTPGSLVEGTGLALLRLPTQKTQVVLVEVEDGKVLPFRKSNPGGLTYEERRGSFLFEGGKLDAWHELLHHAAHHLLRVSLAERRRPVVGE